MILSKIYIFKLNLEKLFWKYFYNKLKEDENSTYQVRNIC